MNHFKISISKSILRIIACVAGIVFSVGDKLFEAGIAFSLLFLLGEILGILEEVFDKRKED